MNLSKEQITEIARALEHQRCVLESEFIKILTEKFGAKEECRCGQNYGQDDNGVCEFCGRKVEEESLLEEVFRILPAYHNLSEDRRTIALGLLKDWTFSELQKTDQRG